MPDPHYLPPGATWADLCATLATHAARTAEHATLDVMLIRVPRVGGHVYTVVSPEEAASQEDAA